MKIFIPLAFAFLLAVIALGLIFVPPATLGQVDSTGQVVSARPQVIPGQYIVQLKDEVVGEPAAGDQGLSNHSLVKQQQNIFIAAAGAEELIEDQGGNVTQLYTRAINGFAVEGVEDVTPLVQDPAIDTIEPDRFYSPQAQYLPNSIDRTDLDRAVTPASRPDNREQTPNIDVAVVDQAVATGHPDLNVVSRANMVDSCGSKWECYNQDGYHATHVAGSIAARDNLGGVVGGLPGARIHGFTICHKPVVSAPELGTCADSDTLQAWNAIIARGDIEIANESVGGGCGSGLTSAEQTAGTNLVNAGVTMFVAAGNDACDAGNNAYCGVSAFICVSALSDTDGKCGGTGPSFVRGDGTTQGDDVRAVFSNFGSNVDIMAPGVRVLSTWPGELAPDAPGTGLPPGQTGAYIGSSEQGNYAVISGTSMASPTAAGIGALIKSKNPSWTPAQIKTDMQAKAYGQSQSCDGFGKGGLVSGANSKSSEKIIYAQPY